jgi:hypothetical protein
MSPTDEHPDYLMYDLKYVAIAPLTNECRFSYG